MKVINSVFFLFLNGLALYFSPPKLLFFSLPATAFLFTITYGVLIFFLLVQKKLFSNFYLTQTALLAFTLFSYYLFGIQDYLPKSLSSAISFSCIFFGLKAGLRNFNVRLILPFAIPFLLFFLLEECSRIWLSTSFLMPAFVVIFLSFLCFFPLMVKKIWKCSPLPTSSLKIKLMHFSHTQEFQCREILILDSLKIATALIMGSVPRFRYVLFTRTLLEHFSEQEIEAVFAHEIGHSKHKHLFIFPFLFMGIPVFGNVIFSYFTLSFPILNYLIFGAFTFCYVRFFIGFFSRRFEKQADLHIFACPLPSHSLISALEKISWLNSLPLKKTNWHHGTLEERILFLREAQMDSKKIKRFHMRVRTYFAIYFFTFVFMTFYWSNL